MTSSRFRIVELGPDEEWAGYQPYGAAVEMWRSKAQELIISGPAETGKTLACLHKLDALAWKYAGMQSIMVRKTYKSMPGTVLQTYENKVLGGWNPDRNQFDQTLTPVTKYGGEKPEWYDYPNGSRLWVGGMDISSKVLSSERDVIYINQAEELTLDEWETLTTRATGRAGNMPYSQVFGDCNPGGRTHWILERANDGRLKLFHSRHEDNPILFDPQTGQITEQGKRTMAVLDALTGVRYQRLRLGKWVSAEGQIYQSYDPALHLIKPFEIPREWRRIRVIDFGLVNPFVCQWWAIDPDGRMYLYRELYMTGRTVSRHAQQIKAFSQGESIEATICDHDAEDRQTLRENGIPNQAAQKDVLRGIGKVQDRLRKQADGEPRLFLFQNALVEVDHSLRAKRKPTCTAQEFDGYIWANQARQETPVKEDDHGMDTLRYGVMYLDGQAEKRQVSFSRAVNF